MTSRARSVTRGQASCMWLREIPQTCATLEKFLTMVEENYCPPPLLGINALARIVKLIQHGHKPDKSPVKQWLFRQGDQRAHRQMPLVWLSLNFILQVKISDNPHLGVSRSFLSFALSMHSHFLRRLHFGQWHPAILARPPIELLN